jgi:hypothetical protein
MNYKVVGETPNIQLVRMDENGKATTARPASLEELDMYKELQMLREANQEAADRLAQLRARLSGAIAYASELADIPRPERSAWLRDRMSQDAAAMDAKENAGG